MLVLGFRLGEWAAIEDDVAVQLVKVDRGVVRLGFHAPKSVAVRRKAVLWERELEMLASLYGEEAIYGGRSS